jgi:hypothetical protein
MDQLARTPSSTAICDNIALVLGGYASDLTDPRMQGDLYSDVWVPSLMTYNISSKTFSNESAEAFTPGGAIKWGTGACLSSFGSGSIVAFLGGQIMDG